MDETGYRPATNQTIKSISVKLTRLSELAVNELVGTVNSKHADDVSGCIPEVIISVPIEHPEQASSCSLGRCRHQALDVEYREIHEKSERVSYKIRK